MATTQRGLIEIPINQTTVEITLGTSVTVGQSYVIATCRGDTPSTRISQSKVELTTIVDGKYTKLKAVRDQTSTTIPCYVEWQVITGTEFTVQSGETSNNSNATVNVAITQVDLSKSLIVLSFTGGASAAGGQSFIRGSFNSNQQISIGQSVSVTSASKTCWYVVEWSGASVQSGLVTISDTTTVTQAITALSLNKAFLIFSYTSAINAHASRVLARGRFTSTTQLEFRNGSTPSTVYISYFAVSHDSISVQSGLQTLTSVASATITLSAAVDVNKSFMPTPSVGNGYGSTTDQNTLHHGYSTHKLFQDGANSKVTIERANATNNLYASWFVVEVAASAQTVIPIGIASTEAFGTATINRGAVTVAPSSIASVEVFGTSVITRGTVTIQISDIESAESFGNATVVRGAVSVSSSSIPSTEGFGITTVSIGEVNLLPIGINPSEAFGSAIITTGAVRISPVGIDSSEVFGTVEIRATISMQASSIPSGETFGSHNIVTGTVIISPSEIASAETFGTITLIVESATISPSGIISSEAFGTTVIITGASTLQPSSIESCEAFGNATITASVSVSIVSIDSVEEFGTPQINVGMAVIEPTGIVSAEAFGIPTVLLLIQIILPICIESAEAFGETIVRFLWNKEIKQISIWLPETEEVSIWLVKTEQASEWTPKPKQDTDWSDD